METLPDEAAAPPALSLQGNDDLSPRSPFSWLGQALRTNFQGDVLPLMVAWMAFTGITSLTWALHLRNLAGWSALPSHWGDRLNAREFQELIDHGGLGQEPLGAPTLVAAMLALVWVLWAGWKLQARTIDLPAPLGAWFWGLLDAVLLVPSILIPWGLATHALDWMGGTGIVGLGWISLIGNQLLQASTLSAAMVLWWFCRLGRARGLAGGLKGYGRHLADSFLKLWSHPVQWLVLLAGTAGLRAVLGFGALWLGWRWGGGTPARVWSLLAVQLVAAAAGAWIMGGLLRLTALYWRQDDRVRDARRQLNATYPQERILELT